MAKCSHRRLDNYLHHLLTFKLFNNSSNCCEKIFVVRPKIEIFITKLEIFPKKMILN